MSDINDLRDKMDQITLDLTRLLKERADIAGEIGRAKSTIGKGVTDEARESALRSKVVALAAEIGLDESVAAKFLNFLLNESVKIQSKNRQTHLSIFLEAKKMERLGKRIIHMEVGEPDFEPPRITGTALQMSLNKGFTKYGQVQGRVEFRRALAEKASAEYGTHISEDDVMVTPGARFAIYLAITTLLNPGDEIIIIEPAWPAYRDCALNAGVKVRSVRTVLGYNWEPRVDEVASLINQNTKMIVLNYPNNPTGKILPERLQDRIVDLARQNNLFILSDEIYARYARVPWKSLLEYNYDNGIIVQSFSKSHAMTGFRIGYTISSDTIIKKMAKLQALSLTSVSEPIQYAAMAALEHDTSENAAAVDSRLKLLSGMAGQAGLEFAEPDGAMYIFARMGRDPFDGMYLANKALGRGLAIAPGEGFGNYKEFIRISACRDEKTIKEGMNILNEMLGERV